MRFDLDNYVDCQERINRFWSEYPNGSIVTELLSSGDNFEQVVVKASVYKERIHNLGIPDATGIAGEMKGTGGANNTSWHENAETSAIGRALANMGYATSRDDRPSRQEMEKVNRGNTPVAAQNGPGATAPPRDRPPVPNGTPVIQNPDAPASDKQINFIRGLAKECGYTVQGPDGADHLDERGFAAHIGATFQVDWPTVSKGKASEIIEQLQAERPSKQQSFGSDRAEAYRQ